ncbi:ABC transporter permease [Amycolatopsis nigrescens]|uniref:ABC transporter permease n=1 Tax=Amycolatopsis nigrescens TaxID=381445 RepID=UPI0003601A44|nr:ABC transporter permease [Amycolatopsis nigrescens]
MAGFLLRRFASYVALSLIATFLAFALAGATFHPLDELRQQNPPPSEAVLAAKAHELGLDQPIPQRFVSWLSGVLSGDFGTTVAGAPVSQELWTRAGVSVRLFLIGAVVGIVLGVLLGVLGAVRQYRFADHAITILSSALLATPVFVLGMLLKQGTLAINQSLGWNLLEFTGEVTPNFSGSFGAELLDRLRHLVLPTLTIALGLVALYSRYQRGAMLDVLGSDYLRTARAKGLTRRQAVLKHGLRTALIPMATPFAFGFGLLITGGVFTERLFNWYGMGDWLVVGISGQDINITATVTLFVGVCVLVSGWLSDLFHVVLDPRIRIR